MSSQVSQIRNDLAHSCLEKDFHIPDHRLSEHFDTIRDFVSCLEELNHVTSGEAVKIGQELDRVSIQRKGRKRGGGEH